MTQNNPDKDIPLNIQNRKKYNTVEIILQILIFFLNTYTLPRKPNKNTKFKKILQLIVLNFNIIRYYIIN